MKTLNFYLSLLICGVCIVGCSDDNDDDSSYPSEIAFTEHSFDFPGCYWQTPESEEAIYLINTTEKFQSHVFCEVNCREANCIPEIDLKDRSLLLASGPTRYGVYKIEKKFLQLSKLEYRLDVTVHLSLAAVAEGWKTAIYIPKLLDKQSKISLKTTIVPTDKDNPLIGTEWKINSLLCFDNKVTDYTFEKVDANNEFSYGNFVKFPNSVNFVSYYSAECGNDCFRTVYGKYNFLSDTRISLSVDSVTFKGECARSTEYRRNDKTTFSFKKTDPGYVLTK